MSRPGARPRSTRAVVGTLILAVIAFAVQQTSIVPAVHDVRTSLGGSAEWSSWLVTVYLIVATVATMAMGRLGDLHGRRRLLLIGLGVFALASIAGAFAPTMPFLIGCRAVQGVGGAVYPLALALARESAPEDRSTITISLLTTAFGVGTGIGFVGGGALAEYVSWRAIFAGGAALVLLAAALIWRNVAESEDRARGDFDLIGAVLLAVASMALLSGITLVVSLGWTSPISFGLLAFALLAAVLWARHERRTEDPLVDLGIFANRGVVAANIGAVGLGWAMFGTQLLLPKFARATPGHGGYGLHFHSAAVGLLLLPMAAGQVTGAPAAGALSRRASARLACAIGLVLVAVGMVVLALTRTDVLVIGCAALLLGVGAGAALQAGSAVATQAVKPDVAAVSASMNSTVRRLAGGVGGQANMILLASIMGGAGASFAAYTVSYLLAGGTSLLGALAVLAAGGGFSPSAAAARVVPRSRSRRGPDVR